MIGGTGFYEMPGLEDVEEVAVSTPFGDPSDRVRLGTLAGRRVAFLARHGRRHSILPSELPQRANLWALKQLGVQRVLSVSAVGSLREDYRPGHFVVPDQLIDRTRGLRPATFFGQGVVAHVAFADPFCPELRRAALRALAAAGAGGHDGGTSVTIEGPAFGTRAESQLYRSWGASIVGMTALPEAKLAREAELCYALVAAVTDYDSWYGEHADVDAAMIFRILEQNTGTARHAIAELVMGLGADRSCACGTALDAGLVTPPKAIPPEALQRLQPILARRLSRERR